jgi:hypothetical protein
MHLVSNQYRCTRSWSWCYTNLWNQCLSPLTLWALIPLRRGVLDTTLCDKVYQSLNIVICVRMRKFIWIWLLIEFCHMYFNSWYSSDCMFPCIFFSFFKMSTLILVIPTLFLVISTLIFLIPTLFLVIPTFQIKVEYCTRISNSIYFLYLKIDFLLSLTY